MQISHCKSSTVWPGQQRLSIRWVLVHLLVAFLFQRVLTLVAFRSFGNCGQAGWKYFSTLPQKTMWTELMDNLRRCLSTEATRASQILKRRGTVQSVLGPTSATSLSPRLPQTTRRLTDRRRQGACC